MRNNNYHPKLHREISFSSSFQYQYNYDHNNCQSPSIAIEQRIHSVNKNKDLHRYESPLKNLHLKYLPSSKKVSDLQSQSLHQAEMSRKRQQSSQKIQKFCEINQRIKKLLVEIKGQENRKSYFCQKFSIQMPQHNQSSIYKQPSSSKNKSHDVQNHEKYQSMLNNHNQYFKREHSRQKQNQFHTPTKVHESNNNNSHKKVDNFESEISSISPLTEKKINKNQSSCHKHEQLARSNLSVLKTSVYANLTQKRKKDNKENTDIIIKGRNIEHQMQKLSNKIKQLQKMKKQLHIQLPLQKKNEGDQIIQSQITKNSIINNFQPQESTILENQNNQSKDSHFLSFQSKYSEKDVVEEKKLNTENSSSNKQASVIEEDVQLPKILRKMNEKKKKGKSQIGESKANQKVLHSQTTNCQDQEIFKQLQEMKYKATSQKNNLLKQLQLQIKLDEQLRKVKKWFQKLKINNKWNIMTSHLHKNKYSLNQNQIKNIFYLHPDQENPFYSPQEGDFTIDECVKAYIVADCHWKYEIVHNFSQRSLIASNFNEENIDISQKGHINIQDLTRYINCQLDAFYRNRDVYLIYQRFRTSEKLTYSDILSCLSNE